MDYRAYLRSAEWRAKREWALERAGHRCQVCNRTGSLEVHHRTYERLGAELPGDLIVLDDRCHGLFHREGRLPDPPNAPTDPLATLQKITTTIRSRGDAA